jgi:hypothetical protein
MLVPRSCLGMPEQRIDVILEAVSELGICIDGKVKEVNVPNFELSVDASTSGSETSFYRSYMQKP